MPRSEIQNEQIRAERVEQIIKAATKIYLRDGIHKMEMGNIAKELGVGRGTVYHYYNNKFEILKVVISNMINEGIELINKTLNTEDDALTKLEKFFRMQINMILNQPKVFNFYKNFYNDIPIVFGDESEAIMKAFYANQYEPIIRTFKEAIDNKQLIEMDPLLMSQILWGALIGAITIYINPDTFNKEPKVADDILEILFNGIKIKS